MTEPTPTRRPFGSIDTNTSVNSETDDESTTKRLKKCSAHQRILTFEVIGADVSVEIRSTQNLVSLCSILCAENFIGEKGDDCYDHMWNFTDVSTRQVYESNPYECMPGHPAKEILVGSINAGRCVGNELHVMYDYGSASRCRLRLVSIADVKEDDLKGQHFPRRKALPSPAGMIEYKPSSTCANMDELFPDLSKFLFQEESQSVALYLFQPRNKKKHQAFLNKGTRSHMIYAPERFQSLEGLLSALDEACRDHEPNGCTNWFGLTIFPKSIVPNTPAWKRFEKYRKAHDAEIDRTDMAVSEDGPSARHYGKFAEAFPKCAAAAGYPCGGRPKPKERGWIVYTPGVLKVCRGDAYPQPQFPYPSPGVWDGLDQHNPSPDSVYAQIQKKITSLQDLFCSSEALFAIGKT